MLMMELNKWMPGARELGIATPVSTIEIIKGRYQAMRLAADDMAIMVVRDSGEHRAWVEGCGEFSEVCGEDLGRLRRGMVLRGGVFD